MGFTWSETITANATSVKASHISELHSNIDTSRTKVGLTGYSWSKNPNQYSDRVDASDFLECRTAIDDVDTKHCSTHCLTHYSSNLGGNYSTHYGSNYGYCASHNGTVNSHCGSYSK